jgi:hypothetical protein
VIGSAGIFDTSIVSRRAELEAALPNVFETGIGFETEEGGRMKICEISDQ